MDTPHSLIQVDDVEANKKLKNIMQHGNETVNTSEQACGTSQLVSTADSTLLASNITGTGDDASSGRPIMEQPSGKMFGEFS